MLDTTTGIAWLQRRCSDECAVRHPLLGDVFHDYRAPTGVGEAVAGGGTEELQSLRAEVDRVSECARASLKILVAKPGLDGHSNGAEQIAVRGPRRRDGGRLRGDPDDPRPRSRRPRSRRASHVIGVSILLRLAQGTHARLRRRRCRNEGVDAPVVVGGIIPEADRPCCAGGGSPPSTRPRIST